MSSFEYFCDQERDEQQSYLEKVAKINSRWKQAKERSEEAQYLEKLIFADYVKTICSNKTIWDYYAPVIKDAQAEINNKKKKERKNISFIENAIKSTFFTAESFDVKIHEIIAGGHEDYYWLVGFKVVEAEYNIQIPMRKAINIKNFAYAHEGKFVFSRKTSSCSWTVLFDDWTESGLAKKIKEYFETT